MAPKKFDLALPVKLEHPNEADHQTAKISSRGLANTNFLWVQIKMSKYQGFIDFQYDGKVAGWVCDIEAPEVQVFVDITDDLGRSIRTCACLLRSDLVEAGFGEGRYGFVVQFGQQHIGAENRVRNYHARVAGTDFFLTNISENINRSKLARLGRNVLAVVKTTVGRAETLQKPPPRMVPYSALVTSYAERAVPREARYGRIEDIKGGRIQVLIAGRRAGFRPIVFVGDKPAWQDPDAEELLTDNQEMTRINFYISGIRSGQEISLWATADDQVSLCEARFAQEDSFERSILSQLTEAARIAQSSDAVAITCWDGGHNPVGRAKVLYETLDGRRPVVIFCFMFEEFGGDIWPPLADLNANIVTIPWSERFFYLKAANTMGIRFSTVWMCKPRAPTFNLAVNIAHSDAKVILDLDDNEEHFSQSKGSRGKAYGQASIGVSRALMAGVKARTAASASLVRDYDAVLVRHVRENQRNVTPTAPAGRSGIVRVGFIGTVRPHKQILEAARAINRLNMTSQTEYQFYVYGDVQPENLRNNLIEERVTIRQNIPVRQLSAYLRGMDVVLGGFPSEDESDMPITRYQISAKIGDALSVGRPVLVPDGPSVADLRSTDGVFLFTLESFTEQLQAACAAARTKEFELPESFTIDAAYDGFCAAEKIAIDAPRSAEALALAPTIVPPEQIGATKKPTLLLIWKQHDSNLYGRRIDLVCRAYRKAFPRHRVVVLEFLYPDFNNRYRDKSGSLSEAALIVDQNIAKQNGGMFSAEGIEYHQLFVQRMFDLNERFREFLISHQILPTNSVLILYPNILHLELLYDLLDPYPIITDVVDNQLAWAAKDKRCNLVAQYFTLMQISDRVVFNSTPNSEFFQKVGFLDNAGSAAEVIPNWYMLPKGIKPVAKGKGIKKKVGFDVFYSGNMNDRIDWTLMERIASLGEGVRLHLIGEASRSHESLSALLQNTNAVFHGVLSEQMTLQLLRNADLTVLPHVVDDVSSYMNPLKVHMYAALGLQTVSTNIPGIRASDYLMICNSHEAFLTAIRDAQAGNGPKLPKARAAGIPKDAQAYVGLIEEVRATQCRGGCPD